MSAHNVVPRPASLDHSISEAFRTAFRNHPAGVAIVTADDGTGPVGLTATSVISVSIDPAMLVLSLSELSSSTPAILNAETIVIHLLGRDQLHLARLCATTGVDRFADRSLWRRLPTGEPHFPKASTWIRGQVTNRMIVGQSAVIAVAALQIRTDALATEPLVYHDRKWHSVNEDSLLLE